MKEQGSRIQDKEGAVLNFFMQSMINEKFGV